jgi:hypothetical protein
VIQAFLKHAPGSVRVATPRLARDLVRSAPRAAAAAYARSADKKLALAWLSYCLSDVDFGDAMGAAALRDAPLLPLADGTLGSFRFGDSRDPLDSDVVFVPSSESEANVLTEMGRRKNDKARVLSRLVDRSVFVENDASPLYDRILAFAKSAIGANSNVKPIDAGGLASLLPDLLPDAWGVAVADSEESRREGRRVVVGVGAAVAWFPEPDGTSATSAENKSDKSEKALDHPTYETLAALWRLFVATSPKTTGAAHAARRARAGRGVVGARGVGDSRAGRFASARVRGGFRGGDAHVHKPLRARCLRRGCAGLGRRARRGDARSGARRSRVQSGRRADGVGSRTEMARRGVRRARGVREESR